MGSSNCGEVVREVSPFFRIYRDGRVERLQGTEIVPPSRDDPEAPVQSKDVVVLPETGVTARLYKPRTADGRDPDRQKHPLLVYFHGGGFFCQSAASPTYQHFLNAVAGAGTGSIVVSVDYRRAPEHPLPAAFEDSWAAINWVASRGDPWLKDHANFERVFFAGDSSGATISHNMALRVGTDGLLGMRLVGIILIHPYFWGKDPIGDEATDMDRKAIIDEFWRAACPSSSGSDDPMINPVLDPRFSRIGCARVLVFVAEKDVLKHRGWLYCDALDRSGWSGQVEIIETEGEGHVFHLENPVSEKAKEMVARVVSFMH